MLVVLAASVAHATPAPQDAPAIVAGTIFGFSPVAPPYVGYTVNAGCTGIGAAATDCASGAPITATWYVFASSCRDPADPSSCSDFTGTLRLTLNDSLGDVNVEDVTFAHGVKDDAMWTVSGPGEAGGNVTLTVEPLSVQPHPLVEPTSAPHLGPSGGYWAVWIAQD
ncbi:MAG: hypothetical protein ACYDCK_03710 [Thermoplasmatota archaeon]